MRTMYIAALALLAGCSLNPAAPVQGVWVFYLDADSSSDSAIDCTENYRDAKCPESSTPDDTGPWTYENDSESSKQILVAEIIGGEGKDAFLIIQDTIVPGTIDGGVASFSWPNTEETTESRTHEDGYHYEHTSASESDTTLTLDTKGETGTISFDSSQSEEWRETDEWEAFDIGVYDSEIPSSAYLEEDGGSTYNNYDDRDCEDDECMLRIESSTNGSSSFTATRTDYDGMDGSNAIDASGIND